MLMKLSELIAHLNSVVEAEGDLPVGIFRAYDGDRGLDLVRMAGSLLEVQGELDGDTPYEGTVMAFHLVDQEVGEIVPAEDTPLKETDHVH